AHELTGEIDRASELEDKLQTQREIIEAAQKGLVELEEERDGIQAEARELEARLEAAGAASGKAAEATERAEKLQSTLSEAERHRDQLEARLSTMREERDGLSKELDRRDEEAAKLKAVADEAEHRAAEIERLKGALDETKKRTEAIEDELASAKVQVELKGQLIEQFKSQERGQAELETENARLREGFAGLEGRSKQAEARMMALRAERDNLAAEFSKQGGAMGELRAQAERASVLTGESKNLKADLDSARERLAELESTVSMLTGERDSARTQLRESAKRIEDLELKAQARVPHAAGAPAVASDTDKVRAELESLRKEISLQMDELGERRKLATKRKRSAREVAGRRRLPGARRAAGAGAKPQRLGRYDIGDAIRRSRAGVVYKATIQPSGAEVEVLTLPTELTGNRAFADRFWREMRVIAELDEPGLLSVMDVGENAGVHYIAYEHLEGGETLESVLRGDGVLPVARALDIASSLFRALAPVAKSKLFHGDIKPENVIVLPDGKVKLAGLGLWRGPEEDAFSLGEQGRIAHYGAPEQILEGARDGACDVWSIGALIFRMITGKPPIDAASPAEAKALVEAGELPQADELSEVPEDIRKVLAKFLAEKREDRYKTSAGAVKALDKAKNEGAEDEGPSEPS
ncbi:MAG: serine/threonine-protein kinase, partial [Planctomycetota bacterium]